MSTPGELLLSAPTPSAYKALTYRPRKKGVEAAVEYQRQFFERVGSAPHRTPDALVSELATRHHSRGYHPPGFMRQFGAILGSPGRLHRLHSLRVPTLVVHGDSDPLVRPIAGRMLASQIPGAELQIIEGMGHDLAPSTWPFIISRIHANARRGLSGHERPMGVLKALTQPATRIH